MFLHTPNSKVRKYTRKTEASYLLVDVSIFVRVFTRKMEDSHLHRTAKYVNLHAKRRRQQSGKQVIKTEAKVLKIAGSVEQSGKQVVKTPRVLTPRC